MSAWTPERQGEFELAMYQADLHAIGAEVVEEIRRLQGELASFRARVFTARCRESASDHSTACTIWGDDGQGGTKEGFKEPLPCNCGALINWERSQLAASRDREAALALQNENMRAALKEGADRVIDMLDQLADLDEREELFRDWHVRATQALAIPAPEAVALNKAERELAEDAVCKVIRLEVCCADMSGGPFICGVWGQVPVECLVEIENELQAGECGLESKMKACEASSHCCMMIDAVQVRGDGAEKYWEFTLREAAKEPR